jgi:uncharacterized membrane protein
VRRGNRDLVMVAVLAAASAAIVLLVPSRPVRIVFALPLLFVLPGLSLTSVLFPRERVDPARRMLLSLGLSLAVAILGALLLDLTAVGLRRWSWALLLAFFTCAGSALAVQRRAGFVLPAGSRLRTPKALEVALLLMALTVVVGAVSFARTPLTATKVLGYSALSIRGAPGTGDSRTVRVEVSSGELQPTAYRLEVYVGQDRLKTWHLRLASGEAWQRKLRLTPKQIAGGSWIRALLYRHQYPYGVYRFVRIRAAKA